MLIDQRFTLVEWKSAIGNQYALFDSLSRTSSPLRRGIKYYELMWVKYDKGNTNQVLGN